MKKIYFNREKDNDIIKILEEYKVPNVVIDCIFNEEVMFNEEGMSLPDLKEALESFTDLEDEFVQEELSSADIKKIWEIIDTKIFDLFSSLSKFSLSN